MGFIDRTGEENINSQGCKMKIIKYNNAKDVIVEFQDKYQCKIKTAYKEFKNGHIKNPYYPSVSNKGYMGEGKYKSKIKGKYTRKYIVWKHMIERCYDPYEINKRPTYVDVFVCEEWHNFQNFAKWFEENYYECNGERMHLDKDILVKGNKIYSPDMCIFVPSRINALFTKRQNCRGEYPIGVHYNKRDKSLISECSVDRTMKHLGSFPLNRPFKAFTVYKNFKEKYIKQIADEYKELIPEKLYDALYRYEVEIND